VRPTSFEERAVSRSTRQLCKTLDMIAANHESAAIAVMRAAERIDDELLRQQLLNLIQRMHLDANQLRNARAQIAGQPALFCARGSVR
jgi:hypothetical protein